MYRFSRRLGFTLIELLVVIAIIAVLAAILFPVFAKVREKSRQTQCASNQKQLAMQVQIWTQDHDDVMPNSSDVWATIESDASILVCPTLGTNTTNGYGYNAFLSGYTLGQIDAPEAVVVTADWNDRSPGARNVLAADYDIQRRHSGGAVYAFVDGHVAWSKDTIVLDPRNVSGSGAPVSSNLTSTSLTLTWSPPADGANPTRYNVYQDGVLVISVTTTTVNITALTPGATYQFTVAGISGINVGPQSPALTVNMPIDPAVLTQNIGTTVGLSWTAITGATAYKVSRAADSSGTPGAFTEVTGASITFPTTTTCLINGQTGWQKYYYRVTAVVGGVDGPTTSPLLVVNPMLIYWKFDETSGNSVTDSSGYGNAGSLRSNSGTAFTTDTFSVDGKFGKGLNFVNNNTNKHYVRRTATTELITAYPYTMSAWVNVAVVSVSQAHVCLLGRSDGVQDYSFLKLHGSAYRAADRASVTGEATSGTINSSLANQWIHVVSVHNTPASRIIYANGVQVATNTTSVAFSGMFFNRFTVGALDRNSGEPSDSNYYIGMVDDVRLYNRALSATEIATIYNETNYSVVMW